MKCFAYFGTCKKLNGYKIFFRNQIQECHFHENESITDICVKVMKFCQILWKEINTYKNKYFYTQKIINKVLNIQLTSSGISWQPFCRLWNTRYSNIFPIECTTLNAAERFSNFFTILQKKTLGQREKTKVLFLIIYNIFDF